LNLCKISSYHRVRYSNTIASLLYNKHLFPLHQCMCTSLHRRMSTDCILLSSMNLLVELTHLRHVRRYPRKVQRHWHPNPNTNRYRLRFHKGPVPRYLFQTKGLHPSTKPLATFVSPLCTLQTNKMAGGCWRKLHGADLRHFCS
jgi:hypothetical protein